MHRWMIGSSTKYKSNIAGDTEWESGLKLLEKASKDLGPHPIERIELPDQPGYRAVAFCVPDLIKKWRGRIREILMDSACKPNICMISELLQYS